jgi:hypothetical protein
VVTKSTERCYTSKDIPLRPDFHSSAISIAPADTDHDTDASLRINFDRSLLAFEVFLNQVEEGIRAEFLPWPSNVMVDWAATCSLLSQNLTLLHRHLTRTGSRGNFAEQFQDELGRCWLMAENACGHFYEGAKQHHSVERFQHAAKSHSLIQEIAEELRPSLLSARLRLQIAENDDLVSVTTLKKIYRLDRKSTFTNPSRHFPEWEILSSNLSELDFAVRVNKRLKICMVTRQLLMRWLSLGVDPQLSPLIVSTLDQLAEAFRFALIHLEWPKKLDTGLQGLTDFHPESTEGRAVFRRYGLLQLLCAARQ